jgi:hypothetical protein
MTIAATRIAMAIISGESMSNRRVAHLLISSLIGLASVQAALAATAGNPGAGAMQTPGASAPMTQQPGAKTPLGDLSSFRVIAADTLRIVNTGDFDAAKKRIKDLEVSWDQAEPRTKPLAPDKWQTVDVAIDHALKEVRAWRATPAASSEALRALVATIDNLK